MIVTNTPVNEREEFKKFMKTMNRRISSKKEAIDDLLNELDLLKHQAYYKIVTYPDASICNYALEDVFAGFKMFESKKDKSGNDLNPNSTCLELEAFYSFKDALATILNTFEHRIFIKSMDWFGLDKIGYNVEFSIHEDGRDKWMIYIPIRSKISYNWFEEYGDYYFKYHINYFMHHQSHMEEVAGGSFNQNSLADIFYLGVTKYDYALDDEDWDDEEE